jgi:hypothetical protein
MARQLIRYNAIRRADSLDDQLAAATIAAREAGSVTQEDLQEGVLSQLKRILVGDDAGSWDLDFVGAGIRSLKQIDQGLDAIDRVIIRPRRTQLQAVVTVPVGQNWVVLSAAGGEVPTVPIGLATGTEGAVAVRLAAGEFGAHRLTAPLEDGIKILVDVVDAATGEDINDAVKNQPVRAVLQVKDSATDSQAFDDALNQAQLSFVVTNPGTLVLEPADVASVAGLAIRYAFAQRQSFQSIPGAGFLIDGAAFVDEAASVDVTRQHAYDLGPTAAVSSGRPHRTDLAQDGAEVAWRLGGVNALRLLRDDSAAGDVLEATVDRLDLNNTQPADLQKGLRVDTADGGIDVGVTPGKIARLAGSLEIEATGGSLTLDGAGGELAFADSRVLSPISFSSPGNAAFLGPLVGELSLLAALNKAATVGGVDLRVGLREHTGATVAPGNNVAGGGFFDFTAAGIVFFDETNVPSMRNTFVFVNGVLERNGDAATPHDVRLGTTPATGDLIFSHPILPGDVVVAVSLLQ